MSADTMHPIFLELWPITSMRDDHGQFVLVLFLRVMAACSRNLHTGVTPLTTYLTRGRTGLALLRRLARVRARRRCPFLR